MAEQTKPADNNLTEAPKDEGQEPSPTEVQKALDESLDQKTVPSKDIWPAVFPKTKKITWQNFVEICKRKSNEGLIYKEGEKIMLNIDPNKIAGLKLLLEPSEKSEITRSNFDKLMKYFNPVMVFSPYVNEDDSLTGWSFERIAKLAEEEWFYGWLPQDLALGHLQGDPSGTFLVRFSSSIVGGYSLDIVDNQGKPESWRVKPVPGQINTYGIPGSGYTKPYKGLEAMINIHKTEPIGKSQSVIKQACPRDKFATLNEQQENLHNWLEENKLRELYPLLKSKSLTLEGLEAFQNEIANLQITEDLKEKLRKAIKKQIEKPQRVPKPSKNANKRKKYKILV